MTRRTFQAGIVMAGWAGGALADSAARGSWSGVLDVGSQRLRLSLEIAADGSARLVSLDQSATPFEGRVRQDGQRLDIDFPALKAAFNGRLEGDRMAGQWHQGAADLPLVFERGTAAIAPPQPLTRQRLADLRAGAGCPGMAAASARRGGATQLWVDGERLLGSGVAVQQNDVWHLGSITKSMTATLVARLVERGAVSWDDQVGDVLGTVVPDMQPAYRTVTFRHLLCHRSGLPGNLPTTEFVLYARELADARDERRKYAARALTMTPVGPPAKTFLYSNNGYVVAGAMLEARLGRSWETLIDAELFKPLGLSSAGFGAPGRAGAIDQPVGHAQAMVGASLRPYRLGEGSTDNPVALGPAGRVHMSLQDLLHYLEAHRDGTDLLKSASWTVLHTPPFGGDYAMGWVVQGDAVRWHNGSNTLWYAEALFDRHAGIVAAAVANDGDLTRSRPAVGHALRDAIGAAAA